MKLTKMMRTLLGWVPWTMSLRNAAVERDQPPSGAPSSAAASVVAEHDPVAEAFANCRAKGRLAAEDSDALKPDLATVKVLADACRAEFDSIWRGPVDRDRRPDDGELLEAIEQQKTRAIDIEENGKRARAWSDEAALAVPADEPPPPAPVVVAVAATGTLALAFGSSMAVLPVFEGVEQDLLVWSICLFLGSMIGGLVVASLFGIQVTDGKASPIWVIPGENKWQETAAGWIMIGAFTLMRWSGASGPEGIAITIALTAIDGAALLYMKSEALRYRLMDDVWRKRNDGRIHLQRVAELAAAQVLRIDRELAEAKNELAVWFHRLERRQMLDFDDEKLSRAATAKCIEAYNLGIDANRRRRMAGRPNK